MPRRPPKSTRGEAEQEESSMTAETWEDVDTSILPTRKAGDRPRRSAAVIAKIQLAKLRDEEYRADGNAVSLAVFRKRKSLSESTPTGTSTNRSSSFTRRRNPSPAPSFGEASMLENQSGRSRNHPPFQKKQLSEPQPKLMTPPALKKHRQAKDTNNHAQPSIHDQYANVSVLVQGIPDQDTATHVSVLVPDESSHPSKIISEQSSHLSRLAPSPEQLLVDTPVSATLDPSDPMPDDDDHDEMSEGNESSDLYGKPLPIHESPKEPPTIVISSPTSNQPDFASRSSTDDSDEEDSIFLTRNSGGTGKEDSKPGGTCENAPVADSLVVHSTEDQNVSKGTDSQPTISTRNLRRRGTFVGNRVQRSNVKKKVLPEEPHAVGLSEEGSELRGTKEADDQIIEETKGVGEFDINRLPGFLKGAGEKKKNGSKFATASVIFKEFFGIGPFQEVSPPNGYVSLNSDQRDSLLDHHGIDVNRWKRNIMFAKDIDHILKKGSVRDMDSFLSVCDKAQNGRSANGMYDQKAKRAEFLRTVICLWNEKGNGSPLSHSHLPDEINDFLVGNPSGDSEYHQGLRSRISGEIAKTGSSNHYCEEIDFWCYSGVSREESANGKPDPLPRENAVPAIPKVFQHIISVCPHNDHVYFVDFATFSGRCKNEDLKSIVGKLMERTDIAVVFRNIVGQMDSDLWSVDNPHLTTKLKNTLLHKVKHFRRRHRDSPAFDEYEGFVCLRVNDFIRYLLEYTKYNQSLGQGRNPPSPIFTFEEIVFNSDGRSGKIRKKEIDFEMDSLYAIDIDMPKFSPKHLLSFQEAFKLPEVLPGGEWCLMNELPDSSKPFMGPNFYATVGGSYTQLHQDGHGTVDSGHYVLQGYNEVIMLRRMPESHKRYACEIANRGETTFDALYGLPHADGSGKKPEWPSSEVFSAWEQQNYYPIKLILGPGDMLHINKGRLHAFRKMRLDVLPPEDCHSELRRTLIKEKNLEWAPPCLSIAYDWMFSGVTAEGISREVSSMIACASLNRKNRVKSLAIPRTAVLEIAKTLDLRSPGDSSSARSSLNLARGLLPSLQHTVKQERDAFEYGSSSSNRRVSTLPFPDADYCPATFGIDPHGNDYFCKLCDVELPGVYFHCVGCENQFQQDFNICRSCHQSKAYKVNNFSNHLGNPSSVCSCDQLNAQLCENCNRCKACRCSCHTHFELHRRFDPIDFMEAVMSSIKSSLAKHNIPELEFAKLTELKLEAFNADSMMDAKHSLFRDEFHPPRIVTATPEQTQKPLKDTCDNDLVEPYISAEV